MSFAYAVLKSPNHTDNILLTELDNILCSSRSVSYPALFSRDISVATKFSASLVAVGLSHWKISDRDKGRGKRFWLELSLTLLYSSSLSTASFLSRGSHSCPSKLATILRGCVESFNFAYIFTNSTFSNYLLNELLF